MANVEFIQKRLAGKEAMLEKLTKKLGRIVKAEASNWENNPYYYDESDKRRTLKEMEEVKQDIEKYKAELNIAIEKENSRNVKPILDFLNQWKTRIYEFISDIINQYFDLRKKVRDARISKYDIDYTEEKGRIYEELENELNVNLYGEYKTVEVKTTSGYTREKRVKVKAGKWEDYSVYFLSTCEESLEKLMKELTDEANRKYDFIVERTNAIVGTITDATNLRVGAKGDLNGFIIGERGKASVRTIDAGGYNEGIIVNTKCGQCYHFRTLINPMM